MSRPPDHKFSKVVFGEALRIKPVFIPSGFSTGDEEKFQALDAFALLLLQPDENFAQLQNVWETNRAFHLLHSSLVLGQAALRDALLEHPAELFSRV